MTTQVVAIDLGATSGRVIAASIGADGIHHETIHRFPNGPVSRGGELFWDFDGLYAHVTDGLAMVPLRGYSPRSIGVDSWAVDYGLLNSGTLLDQPHHYRDERTHRGVEAVHAQMDHAALFARNGLQFLPINTIYQLATEPWTEVSTTADRLLMIPDLVNFRLTGAEALEITNASTTGLLSVKNPVLDPDLLHVSGAPAALFPELSSPGESLGPVTDIAAGLSGVPVVAVASHDTASAVIGTPLTDDNAAYISCGTWGLVGVELSAPVLSDEARIANFTNERGIDGTFRFLHNVMGLWLLNESVEYWRSQGHDVQLEKLLEQARSYSGEPVEFDVNDSRFLAPGNIPERMAQWCEERDLAAPEGVVPMVTSIVWSLAVAFARAVENASALSGKSISTIHLTGGGSLNELLCQWVADVSGREVQAGPVEATALGNILVQARTAGALRGDVWALRSLARSTIPPRSFFPRTLAARRQHD